MPAPPGRVTARFAKCSGSSLASTSQRLLLVAALLAGELDPRGAPFRRDAVWRAALSANGLDAGIALLHDNGLARHGFADQALGLFAHRLLRHSLIPAVFKKAAL